MQYHIRMSGVVTYTTGTVDDEAFHSAFEQAGAELRRELGDRLPQIVHGEEERVDPAVADRYPVDLDVVVAEVPESGPEAAARAVASARDAFRGWERAGWAERVATLRRAADLLDENRFRLAALATYETGKVRLEAVGEMDEAAALLRYYADQWEANDGFALELGSDAERAWSVLRPWGVWAVISPFNFPVALAAGMAGAALLAGNTVVLKPPPETAAAGTELVRILLEAGVPPGAVNLVHGDAVTGSALVEHSGVDGLAFTGSRDVGLAIARSFLSARPRPIVAEMGGKNAVVVTESADLEKAVAGTARSAFGLSGQKCSAASRAYVHEAVYEEFAERLAEAARSLVVGDPFERDTFTGPLATDDAFARYRRVAERAAAEGRVLAGGKALRDGERARGLFVAPTVVDGVPRSHAFFREELFLPFIALAPIESLDEGIAEANAVPFGLTAGVFSGDDGEVERFLDEVEAGVVYANRASGATTGAWPGVQSFGGWKESGLSGRHALGPHYVQQFAREQSRTLARTG
jgi:1-pyrroline-5-carboxylate dehydrogenase